MAGGEPIAGGESKAGGDRSAEGGGGPREHAQSMQPQRLLGEIVRLAADKKAIEIIELDLRDVLGYTDYFLICSGNTTRQTKAIHDGILEGLKREHGRLPRRVEGASRADWILMDYLDVVVHIFTPQAREYYRLEQLWGEAPSRVADGARGGGGLARRPPDWA